MTISSNTLFHFTRSSDALLGILRDEFKPHYCLEDYSALPGAAPESPNVAIPMVCFCDIPLSLTAQHMEHYGEFAIGLTKEWGKSKGVSPVLYTYPGSSTAVALDKLGGQLKGLAELHEEVLVRLFPTLAHVKPYEGKLFRDGEWRKKVRFYDEREWRYVPVLENPSPGYGYLLEMDYLDAAKRSLAQKEIDGQVLSFGPDDIRYLIVPGEEYILPLQDQLYQIKEKYNIRTVQLLATRIITAQQVREDF